MTKDRVQIDRTSVDAVGQILLDENVRSVYHRYQGRIEDDDKNAVYSFKRWYGGLTPVQVIKAVDCLDYQSCETEDWEGSLSWRICQAIIHAATHALEGYDAAQWEMNRANAHA